MITLLKILFDREVRFNSYIRIKSFLKYYSKTNKPCKYDFNTIYKSYVGLSVDLSIGYRYFKFNKRTIKTFAVYQEGHYVPLELNLMQYYKLIYLRYKIDKYGNLDYLIGDTNKSNNNLLGCIALFVLGVIITAWINFSYIDNPVVKDYSEYYNEDYITGKKLNCIYNNALEVRNYDLVIITEDAIDSNSLYQIRTFDIVKDSNKLEVIVSVREVNDEQIKTACDSNNNSDNYIVTDGNCF